MHRHAVRLLDHLLRIEPGAVRARRRAIALVRHHALGEQPGERLLDVEVPGPLHRAGEEARIQQVQDRVLDAADILIDRHPVIDRLPLHRHIGVRAAEAREIPGAVDEGVERVGLPPRRARRSAGRRRASRSDGGPADCPAGRTSHRRAVSPATDRPAPAPRRRRRNGSPGSGSPSSAAGSRPSRAAASSPRHGPRPGAPARRSPRASPPRHPGRS